MRLIPARKIRDGVELARDVVTGRPVRRRCCAPACKLSARYAKLLPKAGVGSVWIEDDLGEDIDIVEPLTPETRAKVHRATADALTAADAALRTGSGMSHAVVDSLADVAASMVEDLLDCPEAALALDDLNAFDDYTHRHSVQVTLLGLLIARRAWRPRAGSTSAAAAAWTASTTACASSASACWSTTSASSPCRRRSSTSPAA